MALPKICGYKIPWYGDCKKFAPCADHSHLKCRCGKPAIQACGHMGSFMCGAPICAHTHHCQH